MRGFLLSEVGLPLAFGLEQHIQIVFLLLHLNKLFLVGLLQLLADLGWPLPEPTPLAWPAAFAWAGFCLEIAPAELVEAFLYGWVANQLSAAVRLVPLGPTEAQRLQLQLAPLIAAEGRALAVADSAELWNGGVGAGFAQLGQAELYSRLFRS